MLQLILLYLFVHCKAKVSGCWQFFWASPKDSDLLSYLVDGKPERKRLRVDLPSRFCFDLPRMYINVHCTVVYKCQYT
jgi:hypothetical protein